MQPTRRDRSYAGDLRGRLESRHEGRRPYPKGSLDPSSAGISYGFIGRKAAVLSSGDRSVVFDLGSEVYEFHSGSTGEQPPFGPANPGLAGWIPGQDTQPPDYFARRRRFLECLPEQ